MSCRRHFYSCTVDSCGFVLPCDDEELAQMIVDRDLAQYTGTYTDMMVLDPINTRIDALGGFRLVWT